MNNFIRFLFPALHGAGVLFYLLILDGLSLYNPYDVYDDRVVNFAFGLMIIGFIGSLIITVKRFGIRRLKILFSIWVVAFLSLFFAFTGDTASSFSWALLAYPTTFLGSILIIVYSFRNAE